MSPRNYLVISDTQLPFEAKGALRFLKAVQKFYKIPATNVMHVGDEVDQYFGSLFPKDPDAEHTPNQEIDACKRKLRAWYAAFPQMRLANSNHGQRWAKKARQAEIPSQMIKAYQEILGAPGGWKWADSWTFCKKRPVLMIHGVGYSGVSAYRTAALDQGMNVVFGHLHANAGIAHINTANQQIWGMNVGCLIDRSAYAFHYGKDSRFKPWLGCGVVLDDGMTPVLVPYEAF